MHYCRNPSRRWTSQRFRTMLCLPSRVPCTRTSARPIWPMLLCEEGILPWWWIRNARTIQWCGQGTRTCVFRPTCLLLACRRIIRRACLMPAGTTKVSAVTHSIWWTKQCHSRITGTKNSRKCQRQPDLQTITCMKKALLLNCRRRVHSLSERWCSRLQDRGKAW